MDDEFNLDSAFSNLDFKIGELNLCYLLLSNNSMFPWVVLIPKRNNIKEIIDLSKKDQYLLMEEIEIISKIMKNLFYPDKLNIAAFGNIVSQLHIHIIARYKSDACWPNSVFNGASEIYENEKRENIINIIIGALKDECYES